MESLKNLKSGLMMIAAVTGNKIVDKSYGWITASSVLVLTIAMSAEVQPVSAQVACGDTITGNAILSSDLLCSTNPALTVDGGRLDMNGFTVECDNSGDGIVLLGKNSRLANGTVIGCEDGVKLLGDGGHHVNNVTSTDNDEEGFAIRSDNNHLVDCRASNNGDEGFSIDSDNNQLVGCTSSENDDGILVTGDANHIVNCTVDDNADAGIKLRSGERNHVVGNLIRGENGDEGISIGGGADKNKINANIIEDMGDEGILIRSNNDDNKVSGNQVLNSDKEGIKIDASAEGNQITGNTSIGSGNDDLFDGNVDCDENRWKGNTFETANDDCIN